MLLLNKYRYGLKKESVSLLTTQLLGGNTVTAGKGEGKARHSEIVLDATPINVALRSVWIMRCSERAEMFKMSLLFCLRNSWKAIKTSFSDYALLKVWVRPGFERFVYMFWPSKAHFQGNCRYLQCEPRHFFLTLKDCPARYRRPTRIEGFITLFLNLETEKGGIIFHYTRTLFVYKVVWLVFGSTLNLFFTGTVLLPVD